MLRGSLRAVANRDEELARRVWQEDDEVDALYQEVYRQIFENMAHDPGASGTPPTYCG